MLVVMQAQASEEQIRAVCQKVEALGYRAHPNRQIRGLENPLFLRSNHCGRAPSGAPKRVHLSTVLCKPVRSLPTLRAPNRITIRRLAPGVPRPKCPPLLHGGQRANMHAPFPAQRPPTVSTRRKLAPRARRKQRLRSENLRSAPAAAKVSMRSASPAPKSLYRISRSFGTK